MCSNTPDREEITTLINHCINNSYFPVKWKEAIIVPIPKKQGIIEPKDFRPISMTSNIGKLLEDVISRQIKTNLVAEAIPWTKFGFTEGHSTVDALTVFKGEIDNTRKRGEFMAVGSLDIKKAFDSVWHRGLVYKVQKAGCDMHTTRIVKSFLEDRFAKIKIDDNLSESLSINRGVPQGTRLGPLLYNIYTGDLKPDLTTQ